MRGFFNKLSLTAKLAAIIVGVNLCGLAALSVYTWNSQENTSLSGAISNWSRSTEQFATLSAGGVKWGRKDAVADAYKLYRDDPSLNLLGFSAVNGDHKVVDNWSRKDEVLQADIKTLLANGNAGAKALTIDRSKLSDGLVAVTTPLPNSKSGKPIGFVTTVWTAKQIFADARNNALLQLVLQAGIMAIAVVFFLFAMRRFMGTPLNVLSNRISGLQAGDFESQVAYQKNGDEIGVVARALDVFRQEAIAKQEQERHTIKQREALDAERGRTAEITATNARMQASVVASLASALERLAEGDFSVELADLGDEFAKVRSDFNRMVSAVADALTDIKSASSAIENGTVELANAADQLSNRTAQQAASLEETAAAIEEITSTVRASSDHAAQAGTLVSDTRQGAHVSAETVREAIKAMDRIQDSAAQINQIIGVIDEIAFQTNLLALNAGVEAARAGDAGKGFAVVAQEVRELAQRSASAAKEIKQLITVSGEEVDNGVTLVNRTGAALLEMEEQIKTVDESIASIVQSYAEQSSGLAEINVAINQMDQVTQQNAAMVEETNAACHDLVQQGNVLKKASGRFATNAVAAVAGPLSAAAPEPARPVDERKAPVRRKSAGGFNGNAALADTWEEF